jgi:hypothetical protein
MLFTTIMNLDIPLSDALQLNELSSVLQACEDYLITTKMNNRIGEDVQYFSEDLSNEFICLFHSYVKRTHKTTSKSACNSLIFRSQSPARSMSRSIKLRYNSDSSFSSILYY